ncbi:hypothetical protein Tco_1139605 [Tanacetum coccineum]
MISIPPVDACKTANEMWIAIERLQQGESLNVQDVKTNLFWEFGKFTSRDGESMESYYSRSNLTLDTEENKMILKQLKKANASLTQELKECITNLDETSRALGEATSCRDSCLVALQNK